MDNLRNMLDIRRMDKVPNTCIREVCGVTKGLIVFFSVSAMWKELKNIGLSRVCM